MSHQKDNVIDVTRALKALGFNGRATEDIDVIQTEVDATLKTAAAKVAKKLHYEENWLNNEVHDLGRRLGKGWKRKTFILFKGEGLIVKTISRQDLINSKFHAVVNRQGEDLPDIVFLNPSDEELRVAAEYATAQGEADGVETQSVFVDGWFKLVKKELGRT